MRLPKPPHLLPLASAILVAVGVAINSGLEPSVRTLPAILVISIGLLGVVSDVSDRPLERLRQTTARWWAIAFVVFLPYGLVTAPSSEEARALGETLSTAIPVVVFESAAGSVFLCAAAVTALYAMAVYGIHPGRPSPEERVLDGFDD